MFFFITMIIAGLSTALPLRKKRDVFLGVAARQSVLLLNFYGITFSGKPFW